MFHFESTHIEGLQVITFDQYRDERGFFSETYRARDFSGHEILMLLQENCSCSKKGVVRGLHYQIEPCEIGKLVRCVKGSIFDVAVDVRSGSNTYGQYYSITLTEFGNQMLWIPVGFAHGFCSLEDDSVILYKTSGYYSPKHERTIRWNDPKINIKWPLQDVIVSPKDAAAGGLPEQC